LIEELADAEPLLAVLVDSLSDERAAVSAAASERLLEEIESWQVGRSADVRGALAVATCLSASNETDRTPTAGQREIAQRVLGWLEKANVDASTAKRGLCVLLADSTQPAGTETVSGNQPTIAMRESELLEAPIKAVWHEVTELADVKVEQTPVRPLNDVALPSDEPQVVDEIAPRPFVPPAEVLSTGKSRRDVNSTGDVLPTRQAVYEGRSAVHLSSVVDPQATTDNLVEVLKTLRRATATERAELKRQLTEQGLSEVELVLADELASAPPGRRQQLAQTLPDLRSIDTRRWLKALAEDEDAEVRLTAMGLLVTTGDPALVAFVRQRAIRDPELRIREQLSLQLNTNQAN
jgi:hypothetical protein